MGNRQRILIVNHIYAQTYDKCQLTVKRQCAILDLFIKNTMIKTEKGMGTNGNCFTGQRSFKAV